MSEECRYAGTPECMPTRHHLYFPACAYKGIVERAFRALPENSIYLERCDHDAVHREQDPPPKPSLEYMKQVILESEVHISSKLRKAL